MVYQVRVSTPSFDSGISFTDPIILERADSITLTKTVSSSDESIQFSMPLNDPKLKLIDYLRWWECWDTETNQRLNYGPFENTSRKSGDKKVFTGPGRSAVLQDYIESIQTFYMPINQFLDGIRFENLSAEPRTSTIINQATESEYYGLSKRSKDYAIDEQTGYISIGRDSPERGTIKTDQFWSGVGRADYLTIDLGDTYTISKAKVLLPWWGGETINNNRVYDWTFGYSPDNGSFNTVYDTPDPNYHRTAPPDGTVLYFGDDGFEPDQEEASSSSIASRYWKLDIQNTHAYYGNVFTQTVSDEWGWECGETNVLLGETRESPTISGGIIPKDALTPSSDCHASAVEIGLYRKVIDRDTITGLSYRQIDGSSRQITYIHIPDSTEMISAGSKSKFEPGSFFRHVTYTGGNGVPIKDEYNVPIDDGTTGEINCPSYTRMLLFDAGAQVTEVDTWLARADAFSFGGSYSYSKGPWSDSDSAVLHFRGVSVKWYATVPDTEVPGSVSIELRSKDNITGAWGGWTVLEANFTVPSNVSSRKIWEITTESGILENDTVYELRISKLDTNFVSIDAFAGFWSASMSVLNEDDNRLKLRDPNEALQLYNQRFSLGSMYEFKDKGTLTKAGVSFYGDRVIVYSHKGNNYGLIKLAITYDDPILGPIVYPLQGTGQADGSIVIDLQYPYSITQAVVFDSNEWTFTGADTPLPWGYWRLGIYKPDDASPIWLDGVDIHEESGLSVKFLQTTKLDILKATAEATQMEWDITEAGIKVVPRLGVDTDVIYAEGRGGDAVEITDVEDISQIATMLYSSGSDIDGLPLTSVVEDKGTRRDFGRTIQRLYDLRNVADYFTLLGASRTELRKRKRPQKRITVETSDLRISEGDSFIAWTPELETRARAMTIQRSQSSSGGRTYQIEAVEWPLID